MHDAYGTSAMTPGMQGQLTNGGPQAISPLENLKIRRQYLVQQLADFDAAIQALEANPEVTNVLELLAKTERY